MDITFPLLVPASRGAEDDMKIRLTSILVAKKELLCCELGDGAVILDLDSGIYYGLDPVGTYVWAQIQEPKVMTDLIADLRDAYAVDPTQCEQDLRKFLVTMIERNLIELRNGSTPRATFASTAQD